MESQKPRWFSQSLVENGARFGISSLPSLTAWLSLCMLTGGWVATLPPEVRSNWSMAGVFGLVAAAGLDVVRRGREAWHKRRQGRLVQQRVLRNLTELASRSAQTTETGVSGQESGA